MVNYDFSIDGIISNSKKWERYYMNKFKEYVNYIKEQRKNKKDEKSHQQTKLD